MDRKKKILDLENVEKMAVIITYFWLSFFLIVLTIGLMMVIAACGTSSGSSHNENPPPHVNYPTVINCAGCPDPAPDTYLWATTSNIYLLIGGLPADNPNMQAFADADQVLVCLRQWNIDTFKRTSCYDQTGVKPGAYNAQYFVWTGLGEFCPGDQFCAAGGISYLELYIDDGTASWSAYAIPGVYPPFI